MLGFPSFTTSLRDVHELWWTPSFRAHLQLQELNAPLDGTSPSGTANTQLHQANQQQQQQQLRNPATSSRRNNPSVKHQSPLAQLAAEEAAIDQRKANIRCFGSTWIRPIGMQKTYQAMMDELAERAEQEAATAAEPEFLEPLPQEMLNDLLNPLGPQNIPAGGLHAALTVDGMQDVAMERNLDDEVPEAEDGGEDWEVDEEEMEVEEEQDLDDDVPEAGSYQHTDTEVEDESSDAEESDEQPAVSPPRRPQFAAPAVRGDQNAARASNVSSHGESSMLMSSPIASRAPPRREEGGPSRR